MQAANKVSRPFTLELKAGVPQTIEQESEFVFVEQGRDLVIRCDSVIHDGVQRGAKLRPNAPFKRLTVTSVYDQQVRLRAGWGDWDYLIVTGELNVSAYVETRGRGQALSLPMDFTRRLFVDSLAETAVTSGDEKFAGATVATSAADACAWYGDRFYGFGGNGTVNEFKPSTLAGTFEASHTIIGDYAGGGGNVTAAAILPNGWVYFVTNQSNKYYLYRMRFGVWDAELLDNNWFQDNGSGGRDGKGCAVVGNKIYFLFNSELAGQTPIWNLREIDGGNLEGWGSPRDVVLSRQDWAYNASDNYLHQKPGGGVLANGSSSELWGLEPASGEVTSTSYATFNAGVHQAAFDPTGLYIGKNKAVGDTWSVNYVETGTVYGGVYWQEGTDAATRIDVPLIEPPSYYVNGAGNYVFTAGVLDLMAKAYAPNLAADVLDYVVKVVASDGTVETTIGSGTATFALRGIADEFRAVDGADVTVGVLPDLFGQ